MSDDNASNQQQDDQALWGIPGPDWEKWKTIRRARLWQAAALLCSYAPEELETSAGSGKLNTIFGRGVPQQVTNLIDLARNNLGAGLLKSVKLDIGNPEDSEVDLTAFTTWANSIGLELPSCLPWQPEINLSITGWPWGRHETNLLRKLAYAADKWWKNYDPTDPTTAPTNEQVAEWLKSENVAARTAEVMATILRADGLSTGPRK